jgi:hypothetical protein
MRQASPTLRALLPIALLLGAGAARADVFSPGDLSRPHAALEGLANCTKCHVAGERLAPERCLECHKELAVRLEQGKGFHARIPAAERACERCHHEHQGRTFALVDWGPGGKKGFDHAKTGYELSGKHRRAECGRCHDRRLVQDPALQDLLGKQPERVSLLGAPTACAACHFDEHRAQVGNECQRCHTEEAWKPAPRFLHAKSAYPLTGKHAKVACAKCHREEPEAAARTAAPAQTPPVKPAAFVRYKGLPFQRCTDCHKDPHQGRFGAAEGCTGCHSTADWKKLSGAAKERAFHEKTRYPLRGAHAAVKCEVCHGPFPGVPAKFKGIAFERCTDCHADAHVGQLARVAGQDGGAAKQGARKSPSTATPVPASASTAPAPPPETCDACHAIEAWLPVRFEIDAHDRLEYRLEGAHRAVACALCHPKDPRLERRVPAAVRKELERRKRPVKVSLALLDIPKASDCRTCHRDPHAGQFKARLAEQGCAACHGLDSFRKPRFDHAKDSRYPLEGKHAQVACASCHRPDAAGVVRYKPLSLACASCHADPHAAQFAVRGAPKGEGNDCARCHLATGWKELRFKHAEPFTKFALDGKHAKAACERCHPTVKVAGADVRRYRPLATSCEGCHEDFHKGAFRAAGEQTTRCAACHSAASWATSTFAHDKTGFPLVGAHREASCKGCHPDPRFQAPVARACAACHQDVHQGRLGRRCDRCHEPTSWASTSFDADVHRRSAFPLTGRHAVTPCDSCHGDKRDRGFTRPTRECVACHEEDLVRATSGGAAVDHDAAGFPTTCQSCHSAWRFSPAGLPAHEACFQISSGEHAGIACTACHTSLPPVDYSQPFTCQSGTAACTRCHSCSSHEPVQGFACIDRRCYECHRFSTEGDLRGASRGVRR